jgi:hypothetical protein
MLLQSAGSATILALPLIRSVSRFPAMRKMRPMRGYRSRLWKVSKRGPGLDHIAEFHSITFR